MNIKKKSKKIGDIGEEFALIFLRNINMKVRAVNWQYNHKEIDIIAENDNYLIIIEVKTRSKGYLVSPQDAVTKRKQKFLIEATNNYIVKYNIDKEVRFDLILVLLDGNMHTIEHIEDAFYPLV